MPIVQRGFRAKLEDLFDPAKDLEVRIRVSGPGVYDSCCFGLGADDKIQDEAYVVFYNQPASPGGEIALSGSGPGGATFRAALSRLPETVSKLAFTIAIDGPGVMRDVGALSVDIVQGGASASLALAGADLAEERALVALEIYRKGVWRFAAVAAGFNGGLPALLKHYGGQEALEGPAPPARPPEAPPGPAKVTLEKRGESRKVDLAKKGAPTLHVNLNWSQPRGGAQADLDLGCMWRLKDGSKGVIQALGGNMGSKASPPFIWLDQDDRSGASAEGENLYVLRPDLVDRVLVFAFIYDSPVTFAGVDATVTIKEPGGSETLIRLDARPRDMTHCAACLLESRGGDLIVTKEDRYFQAHDAMDRHYGFGFRWIPGRK
jgi:tellurite resistance protein TerA